MCSRLLSSPTPGFALNPLEMLKMGANSSPVRRCMMGPGWAFAAASCGSFRSGPISQRPLQRNAMPLVLKRECTLRVKSKGILRLLCIVRGIVDCLREL